MNRPRERYCERCWIQFEMARDPSQTWGIVLPPHDADCPKVAGARPLPLPSKTSASEGPRDPLV